MGLMRGALGGLNRVSQARSVAAGSPQDNLPRIRALDVLQSSQYPAPELPLQLFATGEQGVWFDPSDFSTLYQDAAGTVPVTQLGQPVGLILDKSGNGYHASQSTDSARPTIEARSNLLTGTTTLATQSVTIRAAATHTLSFYGTGSVTLSGTSTAGPLVGTGVDDRVALTFTSTAGTLTLTVTGTVTDAQLERSAAATTYQRVTTATDYADIGLPRALRFDGVDDAMQTSRAVNIQGIYTVTAFLGVFRAVTTSGRIILSHSLNPTAINGTFCIVERDGAGTGAENYSVRLRGTNNVIRVYDDVRFTAPASTVISSIFQMNQASPTIALQPLFNKQIAPQLQTFDDGNQSSSFTSQVLRFYTNVDGLIFQIIVRGASTSDVLRSRIDSFVANKMGLSL